MIDVFVSRPSWVAPRFQGGLNNFLGLLKTLGLNPRSIGTTDYPINAPLDEVIKLMEQCHGTVILGYPQIVPTAGSIKDQPLPEGLILPTEWNHIETGLAYARGLPLLLIHHHGVTRGVFDRGTVSGFVYEIDLANDAWPLSERMRGAIQTWKLRLMTVSHDPPRARAGHLATTDDVYAAYSKLGPNDDLLAWVPTWPAFPGTDKEKILEECHTKRIVIVGPVDRISQLPGVFWRMKIRERRAQCMSHLFLYAKDLPCLKMIVAGRRVFLAPEPEGRTSSYYEFGRASHDLIPCFFGDLEGARPVEEAVYTLLLRKLREGGRSALDSGSLTQALADEVAMAGAPLEVRGYESRWVEELLREWIPKCVTWIEGTRGWTALELRRTQGGDFSLRLRRDGKWLSNAHETYLQTLAAPTVILPPLEQRLMPRLRIVITNRCDLGCSYCPPDNEDYPGGAGRDTLPPDDLSLVLKAAARCGFSDFSITGGEPLTPGIVGDSLVESLMGLYPDFISDCTTLAIQTNGRYLAKYLARLSKIRAELILKVSLDTVVFSETIAKSRIAAEVLEAILEAKAAGFRVGMNFVLTKDSISQLVGLATWCREKAVYLKILDLNWYADIGKRGEGLGVRHGLPSGDLYWEKQYISPLEFYNKHLRTGFGELSQVRVRFGVPMFETSRDSSGFFIRIKDSAVGSHYSPECRVCPFFVDRRRCQEGVYEPWITPGLRVKLCRHRPDIYEDLKDAASSGDVEEMARRMRAMLERFYWSSTFVALRTARSVV